MKYTFPCDSCQDGVQEVDYTDEQVKSMTDAGLDLNKMKGRCPSCQKELEEALGYHKANRPKPTPKPLSDAEIKERMPISKITPGEPPNKACSKCHELYQETWLDQDGECPKCQGAEPKQEQGKLL